jgi:histidinol-phosphate/aromatic aminotransferase/cobyric acid decarboxylase-like protein
VPLRSDVLQRPLAARVHGGADARELSALGIDPGAVLDVSTSVNPYGPAPAMLAAIRGAPVDRYPDPEAGEAHAALAAMCVTSTDRVVLGNGATELLWTIAGLLLGAGDVVLSCEPGFSELRAAAVHAGATVVEWRATAERGFALDLGDIARRARALRARMVSLCVPASPSGVALDAADVAAFAATLADTAVVLDQSFLALSERHADLVVSLPDNVLCVRSLTKEHGIPGVRTGYLIAAPALRAQVAVARPAWSVGSAAQAAARAACALGGFVATSRERLLRERAALADALGALGFAVAPSAAPYFVAAARDARLLRERLLVKHQVLVRDCSSFGLPRHVRVMARGGSEAERIIAAFAAEAGHASTRVGQSS